VPGPNGGLVVISQSRMKEADQVAVEVSPSAMPAHLPPPSSVQPSPPRQVLEHFEGFVESVECEQALITLVGPDSERLWGRYPAGELAAKGVREGDRFTLTTIDEGNVVRIVIEPVLRRQFSAEEAAAIREQTRVDLQGYRSDNDYD